MKKTILFGNGLNYLSSSKVTWTELLNKIKKKNIFDCTNLPNTMTYEKIFLDRNIITSDELILKKEISEILNKQGSNEFYKKIIDLNLDNYLTTNYDYAFIKEVQAQFENSNIEHVNNETVYSIRRHKKVEFENFNTKFWQIHGELSAPKSIMLGLDHYCGSVGKIDGYLKGNYSRKFNNILKIYEKIENNSFDEISWIELFFNTDVHIFGFGFDFNETDLWWILNKRARMSKDIKMSNTITYYTKGITSDKKKLFESFYVKVESYDLKNYSEYYNRVIDKIANS